MSLKSFFNPSFTENLLKISIVLFASLVCSFSRAQDNMPEFGKVDIADLKMKECPFDKGADAMNLINYQKADLDITPNGYYVDIEHWVRIKIFSQNGYAHTSINIPYISNSRASRVSKISARTYNLNEQGNIEAKTIERGDIFKEKANTGESAVRFAFSGVKVGSIVELRYTEKKEYSLYVAPFAVQDVIPTRLSVCQLKYSTKMAINMQMPKNLSIGVMSDTTLAGEISCTYTAKNVSAFSYEPLMTSTKDNLQRIKFSVTPLITWLGTISNSSGYRNYQDSGNLVENRWDYLNLALLKSPYFGGQIVKPMPEIEHKLTDIKKLATVGEKINAIYQLVTDSVKWNKDDDFSSADIAEAWKSKTGNKTEINLLMLNLLRKAGIQAFPLLVSTRENGKTDMNFPDFGQFNSADVFVIDSTTYYILDGTLTHQSYKIPPYNILNRYAFLVNSEKYKWLFISDKRQLMKNSISVKADIDSAGVMNGEVRISYYDYAKADVLDKTKDATEDDSKDLLQDDATDLKIDSVKEENEDDVLKPLIKTFHFTLEMQQTGDFYFLDPFFLSPFRKNPFRDSVRHTDVDFGCNQLYGINMFLSLPGNITVSELPANKEIRLADSSFCFGRMIAKQADAMVIRIHFEVLNPIFSADEYPFLKEVFEKVYALLNERIVFKKTN